MSEQERKYWAYFDEAWKNVIEQFCPHLLHFFVPSLYEDMELEKEVEFLDKEMKQLSLISVKGAKYVDKLVKVYLKNGEEQWILVHIEVQSYSEENFSKRMFRYFYKIFERYGKKIVSMAILTSDIDIGEEGRFEHKAYGSGVDFRYLTFKLMDYDKDELLSNPNPIAIVVFASQERERAKQKEEMFNAKRYLIRKLYERGYNGNEIRSLFEFIDWVLQLSDEEEDLIWKEIKEIEEVKRMPYITSVERIGIKKGFSEMILEALDERFGEVPSEISNAVTKIEDRDTLKSLHRYAATE